MPKLRRVSFLANRQVLALARSGALRGRRKVFSRAPPKSPSRASEATAAAHNATVKRRLPKEKARSEGRATRGALRSHARTGRHAIGGEKIGAEYVRFSGRVLSMLLSPQIPILVSALLALLFNCETNFLPLQIRNHNTRLET